MKEYLTRYYHSADVGGAVVETVNKIDENVDKKDFDPTPEPSSGGRRGWIFFGFFLLCIGCYILSGEEELDPQMNTPQEQLKIDRKQIKELLNQTYHKLTKAEEMLLKNYVKDKVVGPKIEQMYGEFLKQKNKQHKEDFESLCALLLHDDEKNQAVGLELLKSFEIAPQEKKVLRTFATFLHTVDGDEKLDYMFDFLDQIYFVHETVEIWKLDFFLAQIEVIDAYDYEWENNLLNSKFDLLSEYIGRMVQLKEVTISCEYLKRKWMTRICEILCTSPSIESVLFYDGIGHKLPSFQAMKNLKYLTISSISPIAYVREGFGDLGTLYKLKNLEVLTFENENAIDFDLLFNAEKLHQLENLKELRFDTPIKFDTSIKKDSFDLQLFFTAMHNLPALQTIHFLKTAQKPLDDYFYYDYRTEDPLDAPVSEYDQDSDEFEAWKLKRLAKDLPGIEIVYDLE